MSWSPLSFLTKVIVAAMNSVGFSAVGVWHVLSMLADSSGQFSAPFFFFFFVIVTELRLRYFHRCGSLNLDM